MKLLQAGIYKKKCEFIRYIVGAQNSRKTQFFNFLRNAFQNYIFNQTTNIFKYNIKPKETNSVLINAFAARIVNEPELPK